MASNLPTFGDITVNKHEFAQEAAKPKTAAQWYNEVTGFASYLLRVGQVYVLEKNIDPTQLVFGACLYVLHLKELFPDGKQAFDEVFQKAAEFNENNRKKGR